MSIHDFGLVVFSWIDDQMAWLQGKGLLATIPSCHMCGTAMVMQGRSDVTDKRRYSMVVGSQVHVQVQVKSHVCTQHQVNIVGVASGNAQMFPARKLGAYGARASSITDTTEMAAPAALVVQVYVAPKQMRCNYESHSHSIRTFTIFAAGSSSIAGWPGGANRRIAVL